jgi:hypothetical protein
LEQVIIQGKHAPGVSERCLSGLCQLQPPAMLAEEGCSELFLKTLHLQTDRRWCASQAVCRLCETTNIMGCYEGSQSIEIEVTENHP